MSEQASGTLKELGEVASDFYDEHAFRAGFLSGIMRSSKEALTETQRRSRRDRIDAAREQYNQNIASSVTFAHDNAKQLHDPAAIEAHLDGVVINVEQPVEIGQKTEVHKA